MLDLLYVGLTLSGVSVWAHLVKVGHGLGDQDGRVPGGLPGLLPRPLAEGHAAVGSRPGSDKTGITRYPSQAQGLVYGAKLTGLTTQIWEWEEIFYWHRIAPGSQLQHQQHRILEAVSGVERKRWNEMIAAIFRALFPNINITNCYI